MKIVIAGVGGQGIITLARLITRAAFEAGKNPIMYETHGLAQRSGSASCFIKTDSGNSAVIQVGDADLVIALEPLEAQRVAYYASDKTTFLINSEKVPIVGATYPPVEEIKNQIKKVSQKVYFMDANSLIENRLMLNSFFFGLACSKFLDIDKDAAIKVIKKEMPMPKDNVKAFEKGFTCGKKL